MNVFSLAICFLVFAGRQSEDSSFMGKWLSSGFCMGPIWLSLDGDPWLVLEEFHSPNEILRLPKSSRRALQVNIKEEGIRFWWNELLSSARRTWRREMSHQL